MKYNHLMQKVLLINDLSCVGKCSLTASIPLISAYDIETIPLPTCTLSNQTCFKDYIIKDNSDELIEFSKLWKKQGITFDTIYTGFFKDYKQIDYICDYIDENKSTIFVDPVLGDNGKQFKCFDEKYLYSLRKLVKKADYISPNLTEACLLTNSNINDNPLEIINKFSNDKVVITSVKKDNKIGYLLKEKEETMYILYDYVNQKLHGTGDVFASLLCANMMKTNNFISSVQTSSKLTNKCIQNTINSDSSYYGLHFESLINIIKDGD